MISVNDSEMVDESGQRDSINVLDFEVQEALQVSYKWTLLKM